MKLASGLRSTGVARWALAGLAAAAGLVASLLWAWPRADEPDDLVVYKRVGGHSLHLHVFHARGQPGARRQPPGALLLFHGGGWAHGHASQFYPQCRHLSQQGITCISVEYRIASRHGSTPADAVADAHDALRWVRRQAGALRIDANRVAAGGGSAGGHLAAALGVGMRQLRTPTAAGNGADHEGGGSGARPAALVLLNPMLDLSPGQPDHTLVAANWQALSPMHHVAPGVPPTLVLNGTDDPEVPVRTVQAFCERLQGSGTPCELQLFQGGRHGFFNPQVDEGRHYRPTLDSMRDFLRRQGML